MQDKKNKKGQMEKYRIQNKTATNKKYSASLGFFFTEKELVNLKIKKPKKNIE